MLIEIAKVKDKNGDELTMYHNESIANTPALPLFLKVYAEIIEKGWCNPTIPFNNTNRVVWVERADRSIAGGICFEYTPIMNIGWIILSFTSPEERGKGINAILHGAFERIVKGLGATHISSLVHVDNESRLRSSKKVGFEPQFYRMHKKI